MRKWQTFLIVGVLLTGCATTTPDPWDGIEKPEPTATTPLALPAIPQPVSVSDGLACFNLAGLQDWDAYIVVAETNTEIAGENAHALVAQKRATAALIDAGRAQRQVADLRAEMLEDERRRRVWNNLTYWIIIGALGAAATN